MVSNMTKTVLVSDAKKLKKHYESALFRRDSFLETEEGSGIHEIISDQRRITDTKPVHIGISILQYSKLMLLKFIDFLYKYLKDGSFVLVYSGEFLKP